MAILHESYDIESPENGKIYQVDLVEGLDENHIKFVEDYWQPILKDKHALAILEYCALSNHLQTPEKWAEIQKKYGAPDPHWSWRHICKFSAVEKRKVFGLLKGNEVEALVSFRFDKLSRSNPIDIPIVYVDRLAVAPWNRRVIQDPQRFKNMGKILMGVAVALSTDLGFDGRCGAHSLLPAEGFYKNIGMTNFGDDPGHEGLPYYEFDKESAQKFIGKKEYS